MVLGKRGSAEGTEESSAASGGGRRPGKRARPLAKSRVRIRLQLRDLSWAYILLKSKQDTIFENGTGVGGGDGALPLLVPPSYDPYEGLNTSALADDRNANDGMLVTYEDPGERDEKRRLLKLFGEGVSTDLDADGEGSGSGNLGKGKRKSIRRAASGRNPGF
jgi:hypothetical protein